MAPLPIFMCAQKMPFFPQPISHKQRLAFGFVLTLGESTANSQWLPGGNLPTGQKEVFIRTEGMSEGVDYNV